MEIAVVGGSLGGLTAACLLADDGHGVTVYERSPTHLEERGAGIGLLPMTSRYLRERAGIDAATIAVPTTWIRTLRRDGSVAHAARHEYEFSSWNTVYREMLRCFDADRYLLGLDPQAPDTQSPLASALMRVGIAPTLIGTRGSRPALRSDRPFNAVR